MEEEEEEKKKKTTTTKKKKKKKRRRRGRGKKKWMEKMTRAQKTTEMVKMPSAGWDHSMSWALIEIDAIPHGVGGRQRGRAKWGAAQWPGPDTPRPANHSSLRKTRRPFAGSIHPSTMSGLKVRR